MYSDEDIMRLKIIKHLVDDLGLNLAGVRIALQIHDIVSLEDGLAIAGLGTGIL